MPMKVVVANRCPYRAKLRVVNVLELSFALFDFSKPEISFSASFFCSAQSCEIIVRPIRSAGLGVEESL
jgi:hypothetical protein